ncbi:MAG: hypothetical protein WD708_06040 [Kiritimatiellia bacterium]
MSSSRHTDFIDTDLHAPQVPRPDLQAEERADIQELGHLTRQRERLESEVAGTARELESLRQQQENLLQRKQTLESLRQRQGRYVEEKQDVSRRIHQCLLLLDKEEVRVSQLQELYVNSRHLFSKLEVQLNELGEGGWPEDRFDQELTRASDILKGARMEFKRALARLDALDWTSDSEGGLSSPGADAGDFGYWLKVGVAIALPVALFCGLSALAVVWALTNLGIKP